MSQYDVEEARIKRQQMIAQALRDAGQPDASMVSRSAGGYVLPISPWSTINNVASNALGGVMDSKTQKDAAALDAKKQSDASNWMSGLQAAQTPDELSPVKTTTGLVNPAGSGAPMTPDDNTMFARQIAGAIKNKDTYNTANTEVQANDKARRMAQYMKGVQLGGAPAALSMDGLQKEMFPKPEEDYTLSEDQVRRSGKDNSVIATGMPKVYKPSAEDQVTMKIIDPTKSVGYSTIRRKDFDPTKMNEWDKPAADPFAPNENRTSMARKQAMEVYLLRRPPPSTNNRNPFNMDVQDELTNIANEKGVPYDATRYPARMAALMQFNPGKKAGDSVKSFSVLADHLDTLESAGEALKNGDTQRHNGLKNWFQKETGKAAPTTFEGLKDNIRGEIVKGITGGPGAEDDRKKALAALDLVSSPDQMASFFAGIRTLVGGQLDGLRQQFTSTTLLPDEEFDTRLTTAAKKLHGFEAQKATTDAAASAAASGYSDPAKEARYQAWKASQGVK